MAVCLLVPICHRRVPSSIESAHQTSSRLPGIFSVHNKKGGERTLLVELGILGLNCQQHNIFGQGLDLWTPKIAGMVQKTYRVFESKSLLFELFNLNAKISHDFLFVIKSQYSCKPFRDIIIPAFFVTQI